MQEKKSLKNLKIKKLTIVGVIPSFAFQRAKYCALELHRKLPQRFPLPEIVGLLELDWSEKLQEWRQTLGREYWCLRRPVAVFFDDRFIGSDIELIKLMTIGNILMENIPRKNMSCLKKHFGKDYITYLRKTKRIYCYLDICIDEVYAGTLTFQLYSDLLPRTCENFKVLCLGSRGPLLSYRGSRIHRIVKKGWLQGGDIQYKTGGGGFSIFCDPLEDECFGISHDRRGVLSMASGGRHSNGSQFFVTLQPSKWMDGNFVAFGRLIEGARLLKTLENLDTFYECPLRRVEIKSCGKLDLEDVEDVDVMYKEEPLPVKKVKRIETISEQVVRLIMEALTDALARRERTTDILDEGDVPSKMNLQLYFQGFYSLPQSILEDMASFLRKFRRELLRGIKPTATEVVEVIMYDLLMAVLTRMTTLDDVRETVGHDLYQKMISGIDMKFELCQKSYVRKLVDQIVSTAESMVNLISKKILKMKKTSANMQKFRNQMQGWVQSFVLQETFADDKYFIAERPVLPEPPKEEKEPPKREGIPCCEIERKKKEEELKAKLLAKYGPQDLCCLGSKLHLSDSVINLYDYFSTCRYDLKRVPRDDVDEEERMPLLDLIEISRFKLRFIRKQENRERNKERMCLDNKVRKWMSEVSYSPETSWLKDSVYPKDCLVYDHLEEIMYGAMTAGLLEMYYFMEEYLKRCGGKRQQLVRRTIYPEDSDIDIETHRSDIATVGTSQHPGEGDDGVEAGLGAMIPEDGTEPEEAPKPEETRPACTCGHPCCVCLFDPKYKSPPPPPPSLDEEEGELEFGDELAKESEENGEEDTGKGDKTPPIRAQPCASDETLVDLNAMLAEKVSLTPEEIDIRSFRWLKPYILEKGCDLKTDFATQVHKWLDGERFDCKGFISKQSLVTRASLLSLSLSLAELIKEENNFKKDIKNFVYDLWDLYFEEMFKEALLENPPKPTEEEQLGEAGESDLKEPQYSDECGRIMAQTPDFDFEKYCAKFGHPIPGSTKKVEPEQQSKQEVPEEVPKPEEHPEPAEPPKPPEPPKSTKPPVPPVPPKPQEPPKPSESQESSQTDSETSEQKETKEPRMEKSEAGQGDAIPEKPEKTEKLEKPMKKKKSPIVIEELVDVPSKDESRDMPPYVLPFWVKFLTELTKQALGVIAKLSRLPRRLYFQSESEVAFDDKMKEWFEFNAFNPQPTKGREIMEYIQLHHKSLTNLEDTARSYLKKKKYSELINRCTRFESAEAMADEIVADVVDSAMGKTENETLELFFSNMLSSAITSSPVRSQTSFEEEEEEDNTFDTDKRESYDLAKDEEEEVED